MKIYETLEIKIEKLAASDVIATSLEVTTGKITLPWQTNGTENEYAPFSSVLEDAFDATSGDK